MREPAFAPRRAGTAYPLLIQRDLKIRGYTIAQFPNPPLWVALVAMIVGAISSNDSVDDAASAVFYIAITIWAYEEAVDGVNGLRRAIGIVALPLIAISLGRSLGG